MPVGPDLAGSVSDGAVEVAVEAGAASAACTCRGASQFVDMAVVIGLLDRPPRSQPKGDQHKGVTCCDALH